MLNLQQNHKKGNSVAYKEFQKSFGWSPKEWYKTNLLT